MRNTMLAHRRTGTRATVAGMALVMLALAGGCGTTGEPQDTVGGWTGGRDAGSSGGQGGDGGASADASTGDAGHAGQGYAGEGDAGNASTGGSGGNLTDASAGGGSQADASFDVSFGYDAPEYDASAPCAVTTAAAELAPLDAYIMLDRSGSMAEYGTRDCNIGSSDTYKWCYAINALAGYFDDPNSWNNWVALQYFPITGQQCSGNGGACATPAVPRNVLDISHREALKQNLNAQVPNGSNTPTEAALRGLAAYTSSIQPVAIGHTIIGILITDGIPEGSCNNSATALRQIVQAHYMATGIRTFVIGMTGADFGVLETIASAGGAQPHSQYCNGSSSSCHYYSVGNGNPAVFIDVLRAIQQSAVGCTYQVPTPDAGLIDFDQVKVEYTPGNGGPMQQFDKVNDASQCTTNSWYYDNNANPTQVILCPDTCALVQADSQAKVDLMLGCLGS